MGYSNFNLNSNTPHEVRVWKKTISNTNAVNEPVTYIGPAEITSIEYDPVRPTTIRVTFASAQTLIAGERVTISAITPLSMNITGDIAAVDVTGTDIDVNIPESSDGFGPSVRNFGSAISADVSNASVYARVYARSATIHAYREARTPNNADVYVGPSGPSGAYSASVLIAPGDSFTFTACAGGKIDLGSLDIYGTAGDGAIIYFH